MGSKRKGSNGPDKHTQEYKEKRAKNNVAVKRSRDKSKIKAHNAQMRVQQLQAENNQLQNTVDAMTSELQYLKDLLITQAGTSEYLSPDTAADLEEVLKSDAPKDLGKLRSVLTEVRRIQTMQSRGTLPAQQLQAQSHNMYDPQPHLSSVGYQSHQNHQMQDEDHEVYHPSVFDPNNYL